MTPFPLKPSDVPALSVQEFTFGCDFDYSPPFADICSRFATDANRAVVWLVRFRALQALKRDGRMLSWIRSQPERRQGTLVDGVFEAAATQPLNESWEFDTYEFCTAVETLAMRRP